MAEIGKPNIEQYQGAKPKNIPKDMEHFSGADPMFDALTDEIELHINHVNSIFGRYSDEEVAPTYNHVLGEYEALQELVKTLRNTSRQGLESLGGDQEKIKILLNEYKKEASTIKRKIKKLYESFREVIDSRVESRYCEGLLKEIN